MTILTVLLVAICFAAWKAPRWVKEIGLFALAFGVFAQLLGLQQMYTVLSEAAAAQNETNGLFDLIAPNIFFNGLKVNMIPLLYGIIIYLFSLVIRMVQKPRL